MSLTEKHLNALKLRIDADIQTRHHTELIPELQSLVSHYPLDEWFHAKLMTTFGMVGRRADGLRAYQDACRLLKDELGVDPSPELRRLHHGLLTGELVRSSSGLQSSMDT